MKGKKRRGMRLTMRGPVRDGYTGSGISTCKRRPAFYCNTKAAVGEIVLFLMLSVILMATV